MDQAAIGTFLKELRNEKSLTQEQLAQQLNVSSRTVSRWETGHNLPDLSILVEIADFYDVDIQEIINGERKSEIMDKETKDTMKQVAEYSSEEKRRFAKRVSSLILLGILANVAWVVLEGTGLTATAWGDRIASGCLGVGAGTLVVSYLYVKGYLEKIKKAKQRLFSGIRK